MAICGRHLPGELQWGVGGPPALLGAGHRTISSNAAGIVEAGDGVGHIARLDIEKRRNAEDCPEVAVWRGVQQCENPLIYVHFVTPEPRNGLSQALMSWVLAIGLPG
jgi:hypothetical protein